MGSFSSDTLECNVRKHEGTEGKALHMYVAGQGKKGREELQRVLYVLSPLFFI